MNISVIKYKKGAEFINNLYYYLQFLSDKAYISQFKYKKIEKIEKSRSG